MYSDRQIYIKRGSTDEETAEMLDIAALHLKNLTSVVSMMNTNIGGKSGVSRNVRIEREI